MSGVHLSPDDPAISGLPRDVFVRDLGTGRTIRASVTAGGAEAHGDSGAPSLSGDGRFVAFDSLASDLLPGDLARTRDVFERDLLVARLDPARLDYGSPVLVGTMGKSLGVNVANDGFGPLHVRAVSVDGVAAADFRVLSDGCSGRTVQPLESCPIVVAFGPGGAGPRTARLVVSDDALGSPRASALDGLGQGRRGGSRYTPSITVDPNLGPPGMVTLVRGEGFPPGATVALRWDRSPANPSEQVPLGSPLVVVIDGQGRFGPAPVLVFRRDLLGPRTLSAMGDRDDASATAEFLVVPSTVQPAGRDTASRIAHQFEFIRRGG